MSDSESSPPPGQAGGGRKKRANHNELERKRRHHQKNTMNDLRDAVPILQAEKPSTVAILSKAKEYIQMLEQRAFEQEEEMAALRKKLKMAPLSGKLMTAPSVGNGDISRKRQDSIRRENEDLRSKIAEVERVLAASLQSPGKGAPATAAGFPAYGSVDPNLVLAASQAAAAEEEDDDVDDEDIIDDI